MAKKYFDWVYEALSTITSNNTPAVLSTQNTLKQNLLEYYTIDEDELVKIALVKYRQKKRIKGFILKSVLALISGFIGGSNYHHNHNHNWSEDVFNNWSQDDLNHLLSGSASGFGAGGLIESTLNMLDEYELDELGLSWLQTPESYNTQFRRHRGHATHRLLEIIWDNNLQRHQTHFSILFPDDYVAELLPVAELNIGSYLNKLDYSCEQYTFAVSSYGESLSWATERETIGYYNVDNGSEYPIELWHNKKDTLRLFVKYKRPSHSIY